MHKYIIKRLLHSVLVLFLVSLVCFTINYFTPIDVAKQALADPGHKTVLTEDLLEKFREEKGLNDPLMVQYGRWLKDMLHGDLGTSIITDTPVMEDIVYHFGKTFNLAILSMALALVFAVPLGILCALHRSKFIDVIGRGIALTAVSVPSFCLAYFLIIIFSLHLQWFPVGGYGDGNIKYMILPSIVMSLMSFGIIMKMTRNSMAEVMEQDYILSAEAKGLSMFKIVLKHGFRNALIPVVTLSGMTFASLLAGTAVVEEIFAWPGIGHLTLEAITNKDFPLVQGCVLFVSIIYLLINLIVDLLYTILNPRIRYGKNE